MSKASKQQVIKVIVVDDHRMVADGLAALVQSENDMELLGIAASKTEAVALSARAQPHVIIMDYHLPDGDGGQATAEILADSPDVAVIMLTGSGASEALAKAIEAGCAGFLVKQLDGLELGQAIRAVHRGDVVIHAGSLHDALPSLKRATLGKLEMTARELEVLQLLAAGRSVHLIADELLVSHNTVRNHIRNILAKLGAHSQLEAVAIAVREQVISLGSTPTDHRRERAIDVSQP